MLSNEMEYEYCAVQFEVILVQRNTTKFQEKTVSSLWLPSEMNTCRDVYSKTTQNAATNV